MKNQEIIKLRKAIIDSMIKTLLMDGEKVVRNDNDTFDWGERNCKVYVHNLIDHGDGIKYIPVEYINYTQTDLFSGVDDMIFVVPGHKNMMYKLPLKYMFSCIHNGLDNDRRHYRISQYDPIKNRGLCVNIEFDTFKQLKGLEVYDLDTIKQRLPMKYDRLVNKLIKQFFDKGLTDWEQIKSMAWEGFAIAMNTYDDTKSTMNFTQFAAFSIRNNILTSLDNELRTVKLSAYAQKKTLEEGNPLYNTVSIDTRMRDDEENSGRELRLNMSEDDKFSDGDVYTYIYQRLEEEFSERDCKMFYLIFGLKGYEVHKNKEVAAALGISEGLVSQKIKKITTWMRKDEEICEMLKNL